MEMEERLRRIKLIVFDIDGVFTDGRTWQDATGGLRRYFSVRDAMSIRALRKAGLQLAVITPAVAEEIRRHMELMGLSEFYEDRADKLPILNELMRKYGVDASEVALVSEDERDLEVMSHLGFGITVPTAPERLRKAAHVVTSRFGGDGAVMEICNLFLSLGNTNDSRQRASARTAV